MKERPKIHSQKDSYSKKTENECRIYVDIMTQEKLSSILVAISPVSYCSDPLSSRRWGDGINGWMGNIVILVRCEFHFIRVHDNLV